MIILDNVTISVKYKNKRATVLENESFRFDLNRIGLVSEIEKYTESLINVIAGYSKPESGSVNVIGRISWPIGRIIQFRSPQTGRDTIKFLCDMYDLDFRAAEEFVLDLVDFEGYYNFSTEEWPGLTLVKFAQALALLPEFDIYLAEGSMIVGDEAFMDRWLPLFEQRLAEGRMLIQACSQQVYLERFVKYVAVVANGKLHLYDSCDAAFSTLRSIEENAPASGLGDRSFAEEDF